MCKANKALDYNKLLEQQAKGKLLKKIISFPMHVQKKYDGNYTVVEVFDGKVTFISSGGHEYTASKEATTAFSGCRNGYYICERYAGEGKLGDRVRCALEGPKSAPYAKEHNKFICFDYLTPSEYIDGKAGDIYEYRYMALCSSGLPDDMIIDVVTAYNLAELREYLTDAVKDGWEGIMGYSESYVWKDTKSRTVDLIKYKKRKTADLICTAITRGEGKYDGMIGSLELKDANNRTVLVGSGLNDMQRGLPAMAFIGSVIEIEYEQLLDTYIQPTFIAVREDKTIADID